MAVWKMSGTDLTCTEYVVPQKQEEYNEHELTLEERKQKLEGGEQKCILLCLDFISFRSGHSIKSDCIFGDNLG